MCYNDCPCKCSKICLGFCEENDQPDICRRSCGCEKPKCDTECRDECLDIENPTKKKILKCFKNCGCESKKSTTHLTALFEGEGLVEPVIQAKDSFWAIVGVLIIAGMALFALYLFVSHEHKKENMLIEQSAPGYQTPVSYTHLTLPTICSV